MKRISFYAEPDTVELIEKIYAQRMLKKKRTSRGNLLQEAFILLDQQETKDEQY